MLIKCPSKGKLHVDVSKWSIWRERIQIVTQCHLVGIVSAMSLSPASVSADDHKPRSSVSSAVSDRKSK